MQAEAEQAEARVGEIRRDDRPQADPGAVRRRSRHSPGQPRAVPPGRRRRRLAAGARPDLRRLRRAPAGRGSTRRSVIEVNVAAEGLSPAPAPGKIAAVDSIVDEATRNVRVQATFANPGRDASSRDVRRSAGQSRRVDERDHPADVGDQLRAVRRLGLRRRGDERPGRQELQRRAPAGRQARRRRAATRWRSSPASKPGEEIVTSGVFKLRPGAAVLRQQRGAAGQQRGAGTRGQLMKFTDLFVRRPVLAIVVNLVILIAGLQSIRSLSVRQFPKSDIAVIRVTTAYIGANADLVRGFITTPLERVIAAMDGIDYIESSSAQGVSHDHRPPEAQLRHQRRADPDPGQGRPGPQRPAARGRGADHRARDRRQPVRGDVPRLLRPGPRPEPDHRLPDAGRAAAAVGDLGRAARRHPRRPHVRDADLAEARRDGGARHLAVGRRGGARREQLPLGPRPHQGLDGLGQPGRQHRPVRRRRSSGSWWSRRTAEWRRRAARRDRRRRPRRRDLRPGGALQRRERDLHGHLGAADRQHARRDQRSAEDDAAHPGAASGRDDGGNSVRRDRLHPERDRARCSRR